jgi:carbon-monoxide dehydrogenase large subunit
MVRSPHAHGRIIGIGTEAAAAMPGVLGVFTGADMAGYGRLGCTLALVNRDGSPLRNVPRPVLPPVWGAR